ncbi:MAG TPA: HIT domain-containing protein [Candidatus Latescibacteria bacterium]|nr:HIT domain-containing protein [Candidatus Latescibacterota bacterium]
MRQLWAPWRMKYILEVDRPDGCILCDKPKEDRDEENLILYRGETCFVIMNKFPYNNGHLMVAPYRHTADLAELSPKEREELMALAGMGVTVLQQVLSAHGFNIGMNLGRVAGAGIDQHLHLHIVPRWSGDTNFMPVLGEVKVISEALEETYRKLKAGFEAIGRR